jgi:glycine dehydrogenase subunit 2
MRAYQGSAGVLVRAYAYIRTHGGAGLRQVSDDAVLAANYLRGRVGAAYELPYPGPCKHEFVATARPIRDETGVRTLDIAKRLIDHGFHPPTIYFPLLVEECLLIEPTETESKEALDGFIDAMVAILKEAEMQADLVKSAPHTMTVRRLDDVRAARQLDLTWKPAAA